jgi:hypothetical protein
LVLSCSAKLFHLAAASVQIAAHRGHNPCQPAAAERSKRSDKTLSLPRIETFQREQFFKLIDDHQ